MGSNATTSPRPAKPPRGKETSGQPRAGAPSLVTPNSSDQGFWRECEHGEGRPITASDLGGTERRLERDAALRCSQGGDNHTKGDARRRCVALGDLAEADRVSALRRAGLDTEQGSGLIAAVPEGRTASGRPRGTGPSRLANSVSISQSYWSQRESGEGRPISLSDLGGAERKPEKGLALRCRRWGINRTKGDARRQCVALGDKAEADRVFALRLAGLDGQLLAARAA